MLTTNFLVVVRLGLSVQGVKISISKLQINEIRIKYVRVEYRPLLAVTKSIGPSSLTSKRFKSIGESASSSSVPAKKVASREKSQCRHCGKFIKGGRHNNAAACNNYRLTHLQEYRAMCQSLGIEPAIPELTEFSIRHGETTL